GREGGDRVGEVAGGRVHGQRLLPRPDDGRGARGEHQRRDPGESGGEPAGRLHGNTPTGRYELKCSASRSCSTVGPDFDNRPGPAPGAAAPQPDAPPPGPGAGRYAPSPSGDLHLGNLRTAILAWALARRSGRAFHLRVEDLDRVREGSEARQLEDLQSLGIDWDGPVVHQSARGDAYDAAIGQLQAAGLVYECCCTRREIQEAPSAPHAPPGAYPGTCRDLSPAQLERGREKMRRLGRQPALRLRSE